MNASGRIDQASLNARAEALQAHPRFPVAKQRFCTEVPAMWLASPLNRRLIADTGAMAVSITVTGLNRLDPVNGASLETMIRGLEAGGLASGNRARSLIAMLKRAGGVDSGSDTWSIPDGTVLTACQQACPTQAIVFGDLNVPTSRVSQLTKSKLSYEMLEELHTKPRVKYLGRVRNPGVDHSHDDHDHGHGHDHSHDHDHDHAH